VSEDARDVCTECEHFRSEHLDGTEHCRYGQSTASDGCACIEFEALL
jgi:hypothetical protein